MWSTGTKVEFFKEKIEVVELFFKSEIEALLNKYMKLGDKLDAKKNLYTQNQESNESILIMENLRNSLIKENA